MPVVSAGVEAGVRQKPGGCFLYCGVRKQERLGNVGREGKMYDEAYVLNLWFSSPFGDGFAESESSPLNGFRWELPRQVFHMCRKVWCA